MRDQPYDWLVEGLLERGDRVILTGGEGRGKSTLTRQIAVKAALGIHPFTDEDVEPMHVLIVDFENSQRQSSRALHRIIGDREVPTGYLSIVCYPPGVDLNEYMAQREMTQLLNEQRPDLLIIGPMYKMADALETEQSSRHLAQRLDEWRTAFDFAIIMESHQPHTNVVDGKLNRPERPYGSSMWMRWPEFGLCLENDGTLRHWRGDRDERSWPEKLKRGEEWMWEVDSKACLICGQHLFGKQENYCSDRCRNISKQRRWRRNHSG